MGRGAPHHHSVPRCILPPLLPLGDGRMSRGLPLPAPVHPPATEGDLKPGGRAWCYRGGQWLDVQIVRCSRTHAPLVVYRTGDPSKISWCTTATRLSPVCPSDCGAQKPPDAWAGICKWLESDPSVFGHVCMCSPAFCCNLLLQDTVAL